MLYCLSKHCLPGLALLRKHKTKRAFSATDDLPGTLLREQLPDMRVIAIGPDAAREAAARPSRRHETLRTANAGERAASAGSQAARKQIGRIMKAAAVPVGMSWMWTLAFGHHEDRTPTHGYAATREAAMAAFAKSWGRE